MFTPKLIFIALPLLSFSDQHLNLFTNNLYYLFSVSVHTENTFTPLNLWGVPNMKLSFGIRDWFIISLFWIYCLCFQMFLDMTSLSSSSQSAAAHGSHDGESAQAKVSQSHKTKQKNHLSMQRSHKGSLRLDQNKPEHFQ